MFGVDVAGKVLRAVAAGDGALRQQALLHGGGRQGLDARLGRCREVVGRGGTQLSGQLRAAGRCQLVGVEPRLHPVGRGRLEDASLSYASLKGWEKLGKKNQWADLMDSCWRTRAYGDFWSYMLVAEGAVDIAAEPELNLYDMAALAIIVEEAGGKFTSVEGVSGPNGPNAVGTNGRLHDEVLKRLA